MGEQASHSCVNGFFMPSNSSFPPHPHVVLISQRRLALVFSLSEPNNAPSSKDIPGVLRHSVVTITFSITLTYT